MTQHANRPIAIGGIFTECNHLGGMPIDLEAFQRCEILRGRELLDARHGVLAGMLTGVSDSSFELAPLLFASACPGGYVTSSCYLQLKTELIQRLERTLPVSGVLVPLHGAMTVDDLLDPEGDLLEAIRQTVGDHVCVVASLDLHAQVTRQMVRHADALLGWETYPHRDAFQTGQRAARLLVDTVTRQMPLTMAMAKVPVITSAIHGSTDGDDPFAELLRFTKSLENQAGVCSTSLFLGHPYLDLPEMGSGGLVITHGDEVLASVLATEIAERYWESRFRLEPDIHTPSEAIRIGMSIDGGPVLLVEAADCCGGGAAGDSVAALRALLNSQPNEIALVPVVDSAAARLCHECQVGESISLTLGHRHDPRWGKPLRLTARIRKLSEGAFRYAGGIWHGIQGDMGLSAVVECASVQILISTFATYDWADEQYQAMSLEPAQAKFVVVKNPMNYRNVYAQLAKQTLILDTPGPTPATLRHVKFQHLQRPYFPADEHIKGLRPTILT